MIYKVDPALRLQALQAYMAKWVDEWPRCVISFNEFFKKRYGHLIPGTLEHAKYIATHCFYCNSKLVRGDSNGDHPKRSSIDHYLPKSKGNTERFVICCAECNSNKGSSSPEALVSKITKVNLKGGTMWGVHGNKLMFIAEQIQKITSDMLFNTGPRIYYFKR